MTQRAAKDWLDRNNLMLIPGSHVAPRVIAIICPAVFHAPHPVKAFNSAGHIMIFTIPHKYI